MNPLTISAAFLVAGGAASAQSVGGGWAANFIVEGEFYDQALGSAVAGVGDLNGDGRDDFAIATSLGHRGGQGQVLLHSGFDGSRIRTLDAPDSQVGPYVAIAAAGDVDRDGIGDIIVGAPQTNAGGGNSGSVLVYSGATGAILLRLNGVGYLDSLGDAVAGAGDVDGDGHADLIAGGIRAHRAGESDNGVARVFSGATGLELFRFDGAQETFLGWAVCGVGDWNGDGRDDFAFSAVSADAGPLIGAGSVFVHSGADGALLHRFDGDVGNLQFGRALDAADVDADGILDLVVGTPFADLPGMYDAGCIRVYSGATGLLIREIYGERTYELFGWSVARAGNLDGDGHDDLIVGIPYAHPGRIRDAGAIRLLAGRTGALLHAEHGRAAGQHFGWRVASAGDVEGNGFDHVLVGMPDDDRHGVRFTGAVYVAGYQGYLTPSATAVSAAAGGTIQFDLRFPEEAGGAAYQLIFSRSGTGPTGLFGLQVPLTPDTLFYRTVSRDYPAGTSSFAGVLSASGQAGAAWLIPPGRIPTALIGSQIWFAAIARDWTGAGLYSSVARSLRFDP